MVSWSETDLRLHQMKTEPKQAALIPTEDERESELHDSIIGWCRRQYPPVAYIHNRMDKKSTATPGAPDFVLLLHGGKFALVECKDGDGKLSEDQQKFKDKCDACGHTVHIVRNYQAFLMLMKEFGL